MGDGCIYFVNGHIEDTNCAEGAQRCLPFSRVDPVAFADIARAFEDSVNKRGIVRRREQGWLPRIFPFTGYGSSTSLYVLARAVMADPASEQPFTLPFLPKATHGLLPWGSQRPVSSLLDTHNPAIDAMDDMVERASATAENAQRGWRQFFTTQVGFLPVTVEIAGQTIETRTDTNGYVSLLVENHGLAPGWHEARITPIVGELRCDNFCGQLLPGKLESTI